VSAKPKGKTVAIVAMGLSHRDYVLGAVVQGNRHAIADEVWAINHMAGVIQCDRVIAMDDLEYVNEHGYEGSKAYVETLKQTKVPVYTTRVIPDLCPTSVEYPLEDVINAIGFAYLNNSVAYAVALAILEKVSAISLWGCDFTYENAHASETGRGCVEFLIGVAVSRGIQINVAASSSLLDSNQPIRTFYGYREKIEVSADVEKQRYVVKKSAPEVPTT